MNLYVETFTRSLNKYGEELCGDCVEVVRTPESVIVVLADGLGSGVKANILATLTTKIASSMLRQGAELDEVVATLAATLPVCQVRQLAYSTFLILQVFLAEREAYLVEFDSPKTMLWRQGVITPIAETVREVGGRRIQEARFTVEENDVLIMISDGVVHAGVGGVLNLGWQWENVAQYLEKVMQHETDMPKVVSLLTDVCDNLYVRKPGDDTTVVGVKIRPIEKVTLFAGPPQDPAEDELVAKKLLNGEGKKVVCGGTTSEIISRELNRPVTVNLKDMRSSLEVPPTAHIEGVDLVTEGTITLSRALQLLEEDVNPETLEDNGISRLMNILLGSDIIDFVVGTKINEAHQDPALPKDLEIRRSLIRRLANVMETMYFKQTNIRFV